MPLDRSAAYVEIASKSLFGLFQPATAKALLEASHLSYSGAGNLIRRNPVPDSLFIVVEGQVGLYGSGDRNQKRGLVSPGRSIELKAYLNPSRGWEFEWLTESDTTLLQIHRGALDQALAKEVETANYLRRLTGASELFKLKNDLRLFGMPAEAVRKTIASLRKSPEAMGVLKSKVASLGVVSSGAIGVGVKFDGTRQNAGEFLAGDYFIFGHRDAFTEVEVQAGTELWHLPMKDWLAIAPEAAIAKFIQLVDPVSAIILEKIQTRTSRPRPVTVAEAPSAEGSEPATATEELTSTEHDDGREVEDFLATPGFRAWLAKRKPLVVRQNDQMDCGAACMATVAEYYGRKISLAAFRSMIHVTRDGASMLAVKRAALAVGMEALGARAGMDALKTLQMPLIALTGYHFVVLFSVSDEEAVIGDPGRGVLRVPIADFEARYSGNVLLLKPGPDFHKYPESQPSFRKYWTVLTQSKLLFAEIVLCTLISFGLGLSTPVFMQFVFDTVLVDLRVNLLKWMAIAMFAVAAIGAFMEWIRAYLLAYLTAQVDTKISTLFLRHVYRLPLSFFAVRRVGDLTTRIDEIEKLRSFMNQGSLTLILNLLSIFVYGGVLAIYGVRLLGVAAIAIPFLALLVAWAIPRMSAYLNLAYEALSRNQSLVFEQFSALNTVRSLNGMVAARWRWETSLIKSLNLRSRAEKFGSSAAGVATFLEDSISLAVLCAAIALFMGNRMSLGQVIAVSMISRNLAAPIVSLFSQWNSLGEIGVSLSRLDDIFTSAQEDDPAPETGGVNVAQLTGNGKIQFENVSFQYGSEFSPIVLRNVQLTIHHGEFVAFVGPSGSGKTTLACMINLLYAPTRGRILMNGVDVSTVPLAELRRQTAMITQESSLFSGTIIENIALGDPSPSFARVVEAAKEADAHEFIAALPRGYSSTLREGGAGLSGGQRQRINIARALYRQAPILIMDEATSALDAISEQRVMNSLRNPRRRRTALVIAHRLNTVVSADRIVCMENGSIVESGTHAELLASGGAYHRLFRKQLSV